MTHIVNPYSHRLGIVKGWKSRWFASKESYVSNLKGDIFLRSFLEKRLRGNYVAEIEIERSQKEFKVIIHTSRPGMIIGRGGDGIEKLRKDITKEMKRKEIVLPANFRVDIAEVASPESSAAIVAQMVSEQLEKRIPFRRVLKGTIEKVMANRDVLGARIAVAGRLGGAEMARREQIRKGGIPLQTLRADIDFAKEKAFMAYGIIGIKVWIYRGMKFEKDAHLKSFSSVNQELKGTAAPTSTYNKRK
ncbi:MAG: ribosomal protein [Patescibacteria group bacterium]|nr:ribosomal protein [Patescibacteria group bacterium]